MRRTGLAAVLGTMLIAGCEADTPIATSIVFDGESHTIDTGKVVCTRQPDGGGLVILAQGKSGQLARIQLTQVGQIVVQKVGLRYDDATGFVADPREVDLGADHVVRLSHGAQSPRPGPTSLGPCRPGPAGGCGG